MRAILSETFTKKSFNLDHENVEDFVVASWKRTHKPLLVLRALALLFGIGLALWSFLRFRGVKGIWFVYMTHWGILFIIAQSALGLALSHLAKSGKLPDSNVMPWYVKLYWVMFNITVPIAFLISIFYWVILYPKANYIPSFSLDVTIHGLNSVVMFIQLVSAAHPFRLLHIYQPVCVAIFYSFFTLIYYYAGGVDPFGHSYIYPVIDWTKPRETCVVLLLTALFLMLMHIVATIVAALRDLLCRNCCRSRKLEPSPDGISNDAFDYSV